VHGHVDVQQRDVRLVLVEQLQRPLGVVRLDHAVAVGVEDRGDLHARGVVVVDDEDVEGLAVVEGHGRGRARADMDGDDGDEVGAPILRRNPSTAATPDHVKRAIGKRRRERPQLRLT
jgi:hypothetical protein